jgi:hypothetical protein
VLGLELGLELLQELVLELELREPGELQLQLGGYRRPLSGPEGRPRKDNVQERILQYTIHEEMQDVCGKGEYMLKLKDKHKQQTFVIANKL